MARAVVAFGPDALRPRSAISFETCLISTRCRCNAEREGAEQHHQPCHEDSVRVGLDGSQELIHLLDLGEVMPRLGRRFAERLHESIPVQEVFPGASGRGQTG